MKKQEVDHILTRMLDAHSNVSDLNFTVGKPLQVESSGQLVPVDVDPKIRELTPFQTETIAMNLINQDHRLTERLLTDGSCDLSYHLAGKARFRVNVFSQSNNYSIVLRKLETKIPTVKEMELPESFFRIAKELNGIVIVTGATGSGDGDGHVAEVGLAHRLGSGFAKRRYYAVERRQVKRYSKKNRREIAAAPSFNLAHGHLPWTSSIAARRLRANLVNICSMLDRLFSRVNSLYCSPMAVSPALINNSSRVLESRISTLAFSSPVPMVMACSPTMLPPSFGRTHPEPELAVVIGKRARNVPSDKALEYVLGYTCGNDVSARRWQKRGWGGQWVRGKSFDRFCPLGPVLVTVDELPDPQLLSIECRLNGRLMQAGNSADMIFPVAELISRLSQDTTLLPGTLILTGTPPRTLITVRATSWGSR